MDKSMRQIKPHPVDGVVCGNFSGGEGSVVDACRVDVGEDAAFVV